MKTCDCKTTFEISGPDIALNHHYGDQIKEIQAAFESAIKRAYIDREDDGTRYVSVNIYVDEVLRPMFKRMYESAGWHYVSYRYDDVRLYLPTPM